MDEKNKALDIFNKRPKFTNCYINYEQFVNLINTEIFFIVEDNLFILKNENDILKFLYFVNDLNNINKADEYLNKIDKPIALEFLSKTNVSDSIFKKANFEPYKIFSRYFVTKKSRKPIKKIGKIEVASKEDSIQVRNIAKLVFDPLCDFIPSVKEIEKFISNKELFVVKKEKNILAFAIYIKEPYGYDFRLNCVNPKHESGLAGYSLVSHIPEDGNKCICWINDKNSPAIRLNESIGFKTDGLKNYIFVRNISN